MPNQYPSGEAPQLLLLNPSPEPQDEEMDLDPFRMPALPSSPRW